MVFNWFRRQFTQPEDPSNVPSEAPAEPSAEEAPSPEAIAPTAPPSDPPEEETTQANYLAWAKAAFQTIQQRQGKAPAETPEALEQSVESVEPSDDAAPVASEPSESPEALATADIPENPLPSPDTAPAPVVEATDTTPESSDGSEPEPVLAEDPSDVKGDPVTNLSSPVEEKEPEAPSLSPTLSAEPEQATELAVPEPIATEPTIAEPMIAFDAGFLWSAEVLAAQGRQPEEVSADEITWLQKLRQGLSKTRRGVVNQIKAIVGKGPLNADSVAEIESLLLMADVGIEATDTIIEALQAKVRQEALPPDAAIAYLKQILRDILDAPLQTRYSPVFAPEKNTLNIWLMTGVNGAGKTTTIGKIAHVASESGFRCLVAAADTFRAAAVQQVKVWAQRSNVEVIANPGQNTDPAAVVFDAITAAQARQTELLLVDTAGRLQNKKNLMDELRKVRQIIDKKAPQAKVESLLVLDATLGQNGLRQAQVFAEAAQLSGVVLTKLDGSAKGGVALAIVQQLGLPIRFIGAGEGIKDLRPFSSYEFVEALLSGESL